MTIALATGVAAGAANGVAAYFDVDGTLTPRVTLFDLLMFDARQHGREGEGLAFLAELKALRNKGVGRTVTNARYFQWWAGRSRSDIRELSHTWWRKVPTGERFIASAYERWARHQVSGHRLVLVSASFPEALAPLAAELGADAVITTRLEEDDGWLTGNVVRSMLGDDKRDAVVEDAAVQGVDLGRSFGYGDHESDFPFLSMLGCPHLVSVSGAIRSM